MKGKGKTHLYGMEIAKGLERFFFRALNVLKFLLATGEIHLGAPVEPLSSGGYY